MPKSVKFAPEAGRMRFFPDHFFSFAKIKIKTLPSEGNFSFVEIANEEANKISAHLANSGIIVRQLESYGLANYLRITIGTKEEMEATINSLKDL